MANTTFTKEELKVINGTYNEEHMLTESDVEKVNNTIQVIENSRCKETPQIGDMIQFTNKNGDFYERAHIEELKGNQLHICEMPYTPFVIVYGEKDDKIYTSTSGGAWRDIPSKLRYVGTTKKSFTVWGHSGACANGAVDFQAEVSLWEYTEGEHEFTTKTHDKFHVTVREKRENKSDYKYLVSKGGMSYTAFHTDEEYQAWLKTYHGVEQDGAWGNSKFVWAFKENSYCVPLEEYLKIKNAIVDSELCNGTIQECKRIIEGTTITTIMPFQNDKIALEGEKCFRNAYGK